MGRVGAGHRSRRCGGFSRARAGLLDAARNRHRVPAGLARDARASSRASIGSLSAKTQPIAIQFCELGGWGVLNRIPRLSRARFQHAHDPEHRKWQTQRSRRARGDVRGASTKTSRPSAELVTTKLSRRTARSSPVFDPSSADRSTTTTPTEFTPSWKIRRRADPPITDLCRRPKSSDCLESEAFSIDTNIKSLLDRTDQAIDRSRNARRMGFEDRRVRVAAPSVR